MGNQGSFKGLLGKSKKDLRGCQVSFLEVSRVFPECLKGVTRKFQENIEDVSKKFHVPCHSSQLPEQKEGLFLSKRTCCCRIHIFLFRLVL